MKLKLTLAIVVPMVLLAAAPTVAHDDNGSRADDVDGGVAGTYYGSSNLYVGLTNPVELPPLAASSGLVPALALDPSSKMDCTCGHDTNPPPEPEPDPVEVVLAWLPDPTMPDWYLVRAQVSCDVEVFGDGTSEQEPDEGTIDGTTVEVGTVPDGTWDDGGIGGACHANYYDYASYNTPGCDYDGARASSIAPLAAPWVGAACDWKSVESGTPRLGILATCSVNGVRDGIDDQPAEALACALGFLGCTSTPQSCASDGIEVCGSDGVLDGANYGSGDTRVPYPSGSSYGGSDSFHGDGLGCTSSDAMMIAYVYDAVLVNAFVPGVTLYPAVQGDIWQVA